MKIKKEEVLKLIDEGFPLIRVFYHKKTEYQIDKRQVNAKTASILILGGKVKLTQMKFDGFTRHYYTKSEQQ